MHAITIKDLSKVYANGTEALRRVNLDVAAGDFFGLIGANGAGKTTMIGILTGLVVKTSGEARIFDHEIATDPIKAKKMIGVVPQEFNFSIFEKVQDIIITQAGYYGIPREVAAKESESLLKRLELWEKRSVQSRMLSGGMKRRLMIARALVHKPKLLILDEPTAGVDVELRHGMWDYLQDLNRQGVTILLTTHYLEEIERMCKNAAIIKNGEIITKDSVKNLIRLWDKETFVLTIKEDKPLGRIQRFNPKKIDDNVWEVELSKGETLNDLLAGLSEIGVSLVDIRPQGHRLEKLFLNILKKS